MGARCYRLCQRWYPAGQLRGRAGCHRTACDRARDLPPWAKRSSPARQCRTGWSTSEPTIAKAKSSRSASRSSEASGEIVGQAHSRAGMAVDGKQKTRRDFFWRAAVSTERAYRDQRSNWRGRRLMRPGFVVEQHATRCLRSAREYPSR
jgi:hypothetical protein